MLRDSGHAVYLWSSGGAGQDSDPTGALDLLQTMVET